MLKLRTAAVLLVLALVAAGCGSSKKTAQVSRTTAAKAYVAALRPVNRTLTNLAHQFDGVKTISDLAKDTKPIQATLATSKSKLTALAAEYTPASSQINAVIAAEDTTSDQLGKASGLKKSQIAPWARTLNADKQKVLAAIVTGADALEPAGKQSTSKSKSKHRTAKKHKKK